MRIIPWLCIWTLTKADPCSELCSREGPLVCKNGSWTKPDGVCHGYFHKPDGEEGYCYHSSSTAGDCPSTGKPVRAKDLVDPVQVSFEWDGLWIELRDSGHMFVACAEPELYRPKLADWVAGENFLFPLRSTILLEKLFAFPAILVSEGLVANQSIENGRFETVCMDHQRRMTGSYWFNVREDPPPDNWANIVCSMLLMVSDQMELHLDLVRW
jgi:hypothetical protein